MENEVKVPESQGRFKKDAYERSLKAIKAQKSVRVPYRAVGENPRDSAWGRDRALEELKGLVFSD